MQSAVSINLHSPVKACSVCQKTLRESKQHRCRRCAATVCSKCSKHKRKEVGYDKADKLVRVCAECVKRDEFTAVIESKPLGISISALRGKTKDLGGILSIQAKSHGAMRAAEQRDSALRFEKTVIICIGQDVEALDSIELLPYNDAVERLRTQTPPFSVRCKVELSACAHARPDTRVCLRVQKWNRNTKKSVKEQEHQDTLARLEQEEERQKSHAKRSRKKKGKKGKAEPTEAEDQFETGTPSFSASVSNQSYREPSAKRYDIYVHVECDSYNICADTANSNFSFESESEHPQHTSHVSGASTGSAVTSPTRNADDLFTGTGGSASKERYAGLHDIEEHPAMALVM